MENYHKYLNVSKIEEDWGFYITTVGYSKTTKNMHYPDMEDHPNDHRFSWNKGRILNGYYIVFIVSGNGLFESDDVAACEVEAGTCFILFPGMWHRYRPDPTVGWEEYWVGFNGFYPRQMMLTFFDPKCPILKTGVSKELLEAFTELLRLVSHSEIGYPQLIAGITMQLLGLLNRVKLLKDVEHDAEALWVSHVVFLLQQKLSEEVNMEELAQQFPISYSKFRKTFKKITGKSPNQYHLDLRLYKAKELLANTKMSIKEVGYHTGFDSPYYFSRLFKAKFEVSPKSFRIEESR